MWHAPNYHLHPHLEDYGTSSAQSTCSLWCPGSFSMTKQARRAHLHLRPDLWLTARRGKVLTRGAGRSSKVQSPPQRSTADQAAEEWITHNACSYCSFVPAFPLPVLWPAYSHAHSCARPCCSTARWGVSGRLGQRIHQDFISPQGPAW